MEKDPELAGRLKRHVEILAGEIGERHVHAPEALNAAAAYIASEWENAGILVRELPFESSGYSVKNIEAEINATNSCGTIVIGAHYDSLPGTPGANDNASGIAAILELARLLKQSDLSYDLKFVAFANEEPPFFQTRHMGSRVYAHNLKAGNEKIVAMYSLETIGYYSDLPNSQTYPFQQNSNYPDTGNFIGFVSNIESGELLKKSVNAFRKASSFPLAAVCESESIQKVIGFSDQWSFWQEGYPAIMVTDTAFLRYKHYHLSSDTPDKLDFTSMAKVVTGIKQMLEELFA